MSLNDHRRFVTVGLIGYSGLIDRVSLDPGLTVLSSISIGASIPVSMRSP